MAAPPTPQPACLQAHTLADHTFRIHPDKALYAAGKWGSVTTVSLMCIGAILLTACGAGLDGHGFMIFYIVAQFMFGYGVGGEYPMAAGSAAERAEAGGRAKAAKRGMEVVLTFSMQGEQPC